MLDTTKFIERLVSEGYSHLCVVPCSFAKNLINAAINSKKIEYLPCASEAVACSIAAGLSMSGKRPIVIVQSSGLTNMGSCITSLLKPYGIMFPIIVSWRTYKEGDSEIQHAHLASRLPDLVDAYGYKHTILNRDTEDTAIEQIRACESSKQICLLETDTFSTINLDNELKLDLSDYPPRSDYLKLLNSRYSESRKVFLGTTGNAAREMYTYMPDTKNFYMAGNMGGALSVGLGTYLAGNDVVVCGGDAEFVMHMGGVVTAGRYQSSNGNGKLIYVVFDNQSNKSTGGQNTYQQHLKYNLIATASGLQNGSTVESAEEFSNRIEDIDNQTENSMFFILVKCSYDPESPRPPMNEVISSKNIFLC